MAFFKYQKAFLAVSATAAMAGMMGNAQAQAVNDRGTLNFIAQIAATTCVLDLGDTASTKAGSKTVNLGSFTTASTSGLSNGATLGSTQVNLALKDATGTNNCALGSTKWDIGVDLPATAFSTSAVTGTTVLTNQAPAANAATNVALRITRSINGGAASLVDFSTKANAAYGTLLSGNSVPNQVAADVFTVIATLQKSGTTAVTPGAFSASLPLLVWYK